MSNNRILWTSTGISLGGSLWDRLKGLGYQVLVDQAPGEILQRIEETSPFLWVGQLSGKTDGDQELLEKVSSRFPELSFVLVAREPSIEQAKQAIQMGALDYISPDIGPDRLWAVLERALRFGGGRSRRRNPKGGRPSSAQLVVVDPSMKEVLSLARKVAPTKSTVLIQGESGTGKEVVAHYIHQNSPRHPLPFIAVNCAALPENLLESELFGHEKGAFTGAVARKKGKFELADGGTLLLDEISEIPLSLQAKLLRVLQEKEIDRVGGQLSIEVDTRIVATTNRDLESEVEKGKFRLDLYYRLNVVPLLLPPLRSRSHDIIPLAEFFLEKHAKANDLEPKKLSEGAKDLLKRYSWPGNVRELENLMERMTVLVEDRVISGENLSHLSCKGDRSGRGQEQAQRLIPLRDMERKMIFRALQEKNGNRSHAAKALGISVRTLRNKLHEYKEGLNPDEEMSLRKR